MKVPDPEQTPTNSSDLTFSWQHTETAVIALILTEKPVTADDLKHAVWGAALSDGHAAEVDFDEGHTIDQGEWLAGKPKALPDGGYYFLVQALKRGKLSAISEPVPFVLGTSPWKAIGDSCDVGGIPGDCLSPLVPAACLDGVCQRICASGAADCGGGECLRPDANGLRVCAL